MHSPALLHRSTRSSSLRWMCASPRGWSSAWGGGSTFRFTPTGHARCASPCPRVRRLKRPREGGAVQAVAAQTVVRRARPAEPRISEEPAARLRAGAAPGPTSLRRRRQRRARSPRGETDRASEPRSVAPRGGRGRGRTCARCRRRRHDALVAHGVAGRVRLRRRLCSLRRHRVRLAAARASALSSTSSCLTQRLAEWLRGFALRKAALERSRCSGSQRR